MAGEKNLDVLIGRTDWALKENGEKDKPNLVLIIDGAKTTIIDDGEITQNGIEAFSYLDQEYAKMGKVHKKLKALLLARCRATGTAETVEGSKGKTIFIDPAVQEGRRNLEASVITTMKTAWKDFLQYQTDLADKDEFEAFVKEHGRPFSKPGERTGLEVK